MPSNVEIKAVVRDPVQFSERAAELSQSSGALIRQHDTFFNCTRGRLKLRDFMDGTGQLIFYERPDTDGPKLSRYSISPTSDPASLGMVLLDALGVKGEVRKERRLFLVGQTRIHLDSVEGLGHYMELEIDLICILVGEWHRPAGNCSHSLQWKTRDSGPLQSLASPLGVLPPRLGTTDLVTLRSHCKEE